MLKEPASIKSIFSFLTDMMMVITASHRPKILLSRSAAWDQTPTKLLFSSLRLRRALLSNTAFFPFLCLSLIKQRPHGFFVFTPQPMQRVWGAHRESKAQLSALKLYTLARRPREKCLWFFSIILSPRYRSIVFCSHAKTVPFLWISCSDSL